MCYKIYVSSLNKSSQATDDFGVLYRLQHKETYEQRARYSQSNGRCEKNGQ